MRKVLFSVSEYKRVVMCPMEKICGFVKFQSGISYTAIGCEFKVNESIVHIK